MVKDLALGLLAVGMFSCGLQGESGTVPPTRDLLKGKRLYVN